MPTAHASTDVLVARQPVFDARLRVAAYELLVQWPDGSSALDGIDTAGAISEIGLNLVMGQPAYVPVTRAFLLEGYASALPPHRVVLAVGPDVQLDRLALDALRQLGDDGYRLALMDFATGGSLEPLLPMAHVVGVTVPGVSRGVLSAELDHLRAHRVRPLALAIGQHRELELCAELGFELFQGDFISKPRPVPDRPLTANTLNCLRLLSRLQDADVDFDELQKIIGRDVALAYNMLRFINSAFFALPRRVESLRDALVLLGVANVRKWATLMAMAASGDKPHELLVTGLVRARMCELLARAVDDGDPEGAFTTGLLSVVDALTDRSMVELMQSLPLSSEIIQALLNHDGSKGRILHSVLAYESGNFGDLRDLPASARPVSNLYAQAVEWATEASSGLPAG